MINRSLKDSSLGRRQSADGAPRIVAAGQHDMHAVARECVETHRPQAAVLLEITWTGLGALAERHPQRHLVHRRVELIQHAAARR